MTHDAAGPGVEWVSASAYLTDPAAIYRKSFATIRAEADLSRFSGAMEAVALRLIHACGMTDLAADIAFSPGAAEAGERALRSGAAVIADTQMVRHGVIARRLPAANPVVCMIDEPQVAGRAVDGATTRSAAQVDFWDPWLAGSVVAIGNAPTALFRLLERLDAGAPRPALILGLPVGFVGAVESKKALVDDPRGVPFIAVAGRRGGSAMAAAAVNALAGGGP